MSLGRQHLRRIRPLVDGRHSLPPFVFACGRPERGRCPLPVPTVLTLPFTSYLEESGLVVKRGTLASGGEISRGLFVFSSALGGESPAEGYSAGNQVVVQPDVLSLSYEMMATQRCPDRYSPEN